MVGNFCRGRFWDLNATWNSEIPDFSTCFGDTVLSFLPAFTFSVLGLVHLCRLSRNLTHSPLPWKWLNTSKLVICAIILLISISWNGIDIYDQFVDNSLPISALVSSCSRSVVFLIVTAAMLKQRNCGLTTSTTLSLFWIVFTVCGIILHRSCIINYYILDVAPHSYATFLMRMIYYPLIYVELFLSIFADRRKLDSLERRSPFEEETFLSFITYTWFSKVIYRSTKIQLTVRDLLPLPVRLRASYLFRRFSQFWNILNPDAIKDPTKSLGWILLKAFWPWLVIAVFLDVSFMTCQLLPPLLLDRIIDFVHKEQYEWRGYFFSAAIFIAITVYQLLQNSCTFYTFNTGCQVKSALIEAVFQKNMWISSSTRKTYPSGNLMNLISVDVERIANFSLYASVLVSAPLKMILIMFLMWQYLGPSSLAGLSVIVILVPTSFYFSRLSERFTSKQMKVKDVRLKYMNEILSGIKLLKFYVWELPFSKKISDTRKEEMKYIRYSQLNYVVTCFVFSCAPYMVALASFTMYLFVNPENVLDTTKAFVTLTLMDQLKFVLFEVPDTISELIQTITSLRRLRNFFITEQFDPTIIGNSPEEGELLSIAAATLSWSKNEEPVLKDIHVNVAKGKIIAVIGPVGSGKTSLLSAILGEMHKISGTIDVKGTIAYVPQQAWILNQSLKENIIFVNFFKEELYNKILDCCCLRPDLEILQAGDETEIGEKGINLSGGQKQRVSLARAVYQDKDLYLLDDPLSAVDVHVRKALFDDVIGNSGLLKKKTRILVTHDLSVLPNVDLIISMKDGRIAEVGTYNDLLGKNGSFASFVKEHSHLNRTERDTTQYERSLPRLESVESNASKNSFETLNYPEKPSTDPDQDAGRLIEDELMESGGVKRGIYLNYLKHIGCLFFIPALLGYIALVSFEAGALIWVSEWSSDPVLNGTQQKTQTVWRLSIFGGFVLAQVVSNVIGTASLVYGSTRASELYHNEMLRSVLRCPMSFFDSTPMGRVMNRFSTDMDDLDVNLVYVVDGWLSCVFYVLSSFIVIGVNTPIFLAAVIPVGLIYYILQTLHLNASRQIKRLESTARSPMYSQFMESVQGALSIKAYNVQDDFIQKFEDVLDKHITCTVNKITCNRWLHFWLDILGASIILVATLLAIQQRHTLSASIVALVITYALSVSDALMWLVRSNTEMENKFVSVERVNEYTKLKSEAEWNIPNSDPERDWPERGDLVFDNYSARYREDLELALKQINLAILPNEKVGIIGRTGAGKSSMTLALFRIIEPISGTIIIDNIDISKIGLHALRSKITIIPQDPVLFTGTLRFNLDPNNEYSDDALWTGLESSHLKSFVSNIEEGLEHIIEEGGANLSAGQRQLLCLSRALLPKTKILVLDEATAAVDMDTDLLIQNTIRTAFSDRTVITIAHRLNTVIDYDKIIVMDSGEVIEVGKPSDLLQNRNSHFFKMTKEAGLI